MDRAMSGTLGVQSPSPPGDRSIIQRIRYSNIPDSAPLPDACHRLVCRDSGMERANLARAKRCRSGGKLGENFAAYSEQYQAGQRSDTPYCSSFHGPRLCRLRARSHLVSLSSPPSCGGSSGSPLYKFHQYHTGSHGACKGSIDRCDISSRSLFRSKRPTEIDYVLRNWFRAQSQWSLCRRVLDFEVGDLRNCIKRGMCD